MSVRSPSLSDIIGEQIRRDGPISFARFVELALYEPEAGYYASGAARVGRAGDFYTSVSVGSAFGKALGCHFENVWEALGKPAEFVVVEQGANDARLAYDVLTQVEEPFRSALRYRIVEPVPALRAAQEVRLAECRDQVEWVTSLGELPPFRGIHFSNELIDALPFHILRSTGSGWEELKVALEGEDLVFAPAPLDEEMTREAARLPARPEGYLCEVRPQARQWLREVSDRLETGWVLVIDYGRSREELLAPHREKGSLACYQSHKRDEAPLVDVGQKDITADVNFSDLAEEGIRLGLTVDGFTDQHHFLVGAMEKLLRSDSGAAPDRDQARFLSQLKSLLHPETMGTQFRYLSLRKNIPESVCLNGFRFQRPDWRRILP